MKKKKKVLLIIIGVVVGLLILFIGSMVIFENTMFGHYPKKLSDNGGYNSALPKDDVLISYSFMNGAWSYTYYGEIVLKDGSRYLFNCTERGANNCRLKKKRSISKSDINKMKKYESKLSKDVVYDNHGADMGEVSIVYYIDGDEYILAGNGDNAITNNSSGAKKILRVLFKYGIYI